METTLLIALSRQDALRRQMAVVAHNMANMNTAGFKAERMMFVDHLVRRDGDGPFAEKLAFVRDVATRHIMTEGPFEETGTPLDVAVHGDGFFVVEDEQGERYTRNGRFQIDDTGQLTTHSGLPVLSEDGQPIFFSPNDTEIAIASDGTISTENGVIARLRVARFENPQLLELMEGGLMATTEVPEVVDRPQVVQGMREGSNVEPVIEMARMIEVHRAYDGARRLVDSEDKRIKKMVETYTG